MWRANPAYASHKKLRRQLSQKLTQLVTTDLNLDDTLSDGDKWDAIKLEAKNIIRKYGVKYVGWRQERIKFLGKARNRWLRCLQDPLLRHQMVHPIDKELGELQEEIAEIASVKAGQRWREQGEKSAGFLKRIFKEREGQQHLASVIRNTPQGTQLTSNPSEIRLAVHDYYQSLYTKEPVDSTVLKTFLDDIDFTTTVSTEENTSLTSEILLDDLLEQSKRCPKYSSPGNDGLGYQYLNILFRIPALQPLILRVFNNALTKGEVPKSWKEIRVRLLPKKGDLSNLKNWRPISLINCDAKIFTRILNTRIKPITNRLVQPSQTGFMESRFIGKNGLLIYLVLQHARSTQHPGIGLLLDQEKAYDRVHPLYLEKVLAKYGFSEQFSNSILRLFFDNQVQVNVNGHFTTDIEQGRGLRQGDPFSPILFN